MLFFRKFLQILVQPLGKDPIGKNNSLEIAYDTKNEKPNHKLLKSIRTSNYFTLQRHTNKPQALKKQKEKSVLTKVNSKQFTINEDVSPIISEFSLNCSTAWYYGEMTIMHSCETNTESVVTKKVLGSLVVRVDKNGDVIYNIIYNVDSNMCSATIPYKSGKYCLDFTDPKQHAFSSTKFLFANLIEEGYLQRVSFTWLTENCPYY